MIPSGFLFALTLAQPWLLLFGLATLVPVLIHFLHRHQHRKLKWAATRYLALAMEKVWRRFSMIQLWLLLLRVALLLLLSICLATPVLERKESWLEGSGLGSTLKIIAMDTSYSMLARDSIQAGSGQGQDQAPTDQQRQDRARQLASQLVEQSGPGDAFLLVTFDDRLTPVLTAPQASRDAVIDRINLVSPGNRPNQLPPVLEALGELVENHLSSPYDQVELHLVSDFAGANWSSLQEEPTRSAWKRLVDTVPTRTHRVGLEKLTNNFISRIRTDRSTTLVRRKNRVQVEIRNRGATAEQSLLVELLLGQKVVASQPVTLPPSGKVITDFELQVDRPGTCLLEARIGNDSMLLDNRRYATLMVREKYEVLFVEGRRDASRFLQLALDPDLSSSGPVQLRTLSPEAFASAQLGSVDVLFIDNVRELKAPQVSRIIEFARSGRTVFFFPGDLLELQAFNRSWNPSAGEGLGVEFLGLQPLDNYGIDPLDYRSPYTQAFRGLPNSGLSRLPIWTYLRTRFKDASRSRVELAFDNGDPLLVSTPVGRGQLLLLTTASSSQSRLRSEDRPSWNALETVAAFPALVNEMFRLAVSQDRTERLTVGLPGNGLLEEKDEVRGFTLVAPGGNEIEVQTDQVDGFFSWRVEAFPSPGFYSASARLVDRELNRTWAANLDVSESDLTGPGLDLSATETMEFQGSPGRQGQTLPLVQLLLIGLFLFLLLELVCGYRLGRKHA